MKKEKITVDILKAAGFEDITTPEMKYAHKKMFYIDDYSSWRYVTDKEDDYNNYLMIDVQKGPTNNGAVWNVHLDNNLAESVGQADIDYVWQFNMLMEIFGSKFRII